MELKFIIDTQLPPALCQDLRKKGFDTIHTIECPNKEFTSDSEIRSIALEQQRIIVTKDADFHDYYLIKGAPPKVLLLKIGNCSNQELGNILFNRFDKILFYFENQDENFVIIFKDFIAVI